MAVEKNAQESLFEDALYCEEEKWGDVDEEDESGITSDTMDQRFDGINLALFPLLEQDLLWDDEELESLFNKEKETKINEMGFSAHLSLPRKEAVEWILRINAYYGFSALTAILAVNYLDRFLCSLSFPNDNKPWMMQLAAVTCLSLASKVEETHVPLLLDLQMEGGAKFVFEAKTIQRMELLVLSSLKWRMNPVTPLSFIDHIIRRLGLKCYVHWEFLRRCENLLLSILSDSRFILHPPSVMATATMLHVIHQAEPENALHYQNQLLSVLKINKEDVNDCCGILSGILSNSWSNIKYNPLKRKEFQIPTSPDAVMNNAAFSSDSSNDSWGVESPCISFSSPPLSKKRRVQVQEQQMIPTLGRVFVEAVGSPH